MRTKKQMRAATKETLALFVLLFVAYGALGYRVTIVQHVVVYDALARLAHAYFVLWNDPPKLAAIGFVWAPISTLVFLPFVVVKSLGQSLVALPLSSAFFTAGLITVLNRVCARCGMRWWLRLLVVGLFALNPMILFYATNGMSEASFMCFTALGTLFLLRWHMEHEPHFLALAAVAMTCAFLDRYEMFAFAVVMAAVVPFVIRARRGTQAEIEGSALAFAAPMAYGLGVWIFFNFLILNDPLFWLRNQLPGAAGGAQENVYQSVKLPITEVASQLLHLNLTLFFAGVLVVPLLFVVAARRRDAMTFSLALLCSVNFVSSFLLIAKSGQLSLLQLRYNMRALPLVIVGFAWLYHLARGHRIWRPAAGVVAVAALAISYPLTWHTMTTYDQQYEENVFIKAITTGGDMEGAPTIGRYYVGWAPDQDMADWIVRHVPDRPNRILTDDGQTFGVMLASGRPDLFFDRIDRGDTKWKRRLVRPWGRVDYLLIARYSGSLDEIQRRFTSIQTQALPGMSIVYANVRYALYRVAKRRPVVPNSHIDGIVSTVSATSPYL